MIIDFMSTQEEVRQAIKTTLRMLKGLDEATGLMTLLCDENMPVVPLGYRDFFVGRLFKYIGYLDERGYDGEDTQRGEFGAEQVNILDKSQPGL